jgi:CHAD domain-containing protein
MPETFEDTGVEGSPETLLESLLKALAQQKEIVDSRQSGQRLPKGENLHDLRVALRRMASLARLSRGFPQDDHGSGLRKSARNLRRRLSLQRTLEISQQRLRRRFARDGELKQAANLIASRLLPHEEATAGQIAEIARLKARLDRRFAERVHELETARDVAGAPSADPILTGLFERRLEKMRRNLASFGIPDVQYLHAFRIATKDLRYALEFLEKGSAELRELRKELRLFQDVAGDAHDRLELISLVSSFANEGPLELRRPATVLLPKLQIDGKRAVARARRLATSLLPHLQGVSLTLPERT